MRMYRVAFFVLTLVIAAVMSSCDLIDEIMRARFSDPVERNENSAIESLARLTSVQYKFQNNNTRDTDGNGVGEFADGIELHQSGFAKKAKFELAENGIYLKKNGYYYWIITDGTEYRRERYWCVYAWPAEIWETGTTAFFMEQNGQIYTNPNDGSSSITLSGLEARVTRPMAYRDYRIFGQIDSAIWQPLKTEEEEEIIVR